MGRTRPKWGKNKINDAKKKRTKRTTNRINETAKNVIIIFIKLLNDLPEVIKIHFHTARLQHAIQLLNIYGPVSIFVEFTKQILI